MLSGNSGWNGAVLRPRFAQSRELPLKDGSLLIQSGGQ